MTCDYCGASTSNGLALCQACRAWLLVNLEFIPVYFRNLSRWRPSSATGMQRVRQVAPPMPTSEEARPDRIANVLDESHVEFVGWADSLKDDRPQLGPVIARILAMDEETCVRLLCALLTKRVDTLTTLPWVKAIVAGIAEVERRLRNETERAVPGWYAGACRRCETPTYVVPGLTWVTCSGCGNTTYARDHLEIILVEARGWVARPMPIAGAIVALVDTEQSVPRLYERIKKWEQREKITGHRRTERQHVFSREEDRIVVADEAVGYARYRFGDVMDMLMSEGATRLRPLIVAKAPRAC